MSRRPNPPDDVSDDAALPALSVPWAVALAALGFALTHALFYAAGALIAWRANGPLAAGLEAAHADALVHGLALAFGRSRRWASRSPTRCSTRRARLSRGAPTGHSGRGSKRPTPTRWCTGSRWRSTLRGASALRLPDRVGLVAVPLGALGWAALLGVSVHVAGAELVNVLREWFPLPPALAIAQQRLLTPMTWQQGVGAVLAFVALAPLAEEVFFRGVVFPGLTRRYGHPWFSLLISALLFGISHVEPVAIFYAALLGAGLGLLTVRARSIVPALVAHAAHNAVPLLLPERLVRIEGLNTLGEASYHLHPLVVLAATLSALLAARALHHSLEGPP
jgi:membrane protease YdiL (CAAX protease family)